MAANLTILARSPGRLSSYESTETDQARPLSSIESATSFTVTSDGSKIFVTTPESVDVYTSQSPWQKLGSIPEPGVVLVAVSPKAQYLVTCQKPGKTPTGEQNKNLKVWSLSSLGQVYSQALRSVSKDAWPVVSWADDDSTFAVAATNAAHIFNAANNFTSYDKVTVKGLTSLALCPTKAHGQLVAGFIPEVKGAPASAALYDASKAGEPTPRVRKAFFRTQGCQFLWNATGTALLVLSFTEFDVTNQSYFGEQKLHYLPADPAKADAAATVALPKDGPVHDVQWSPAGDFFLTVAGFMPAKATLWDANARPIFDFGSGPYNMVRWNPFGRFLILAGFGNLPGDILFFDKKASGTCKQMGATRCPAVSAQWAPDGRHLLVAATAPRLRVDNKAQVITYTGQVVNTINFDTLFEAAWLPAPPDAFQHRAPSPERLAAGVSGLSAPAGATRGSPAAAPAAKPAGYVPPHLRGANGAAVQGAPTPSFSLGFDASDKGGRIAPGKAGASATARGSGSSVPGYELVDSKAASKNAKRRAKKKAAGEGSGDEASQSSSKGGAESSQQQAELAAAAQGVEGLSVSGQDNDPAKKLRNLQKKYRQVQQLKEKLAKEGEKALEPEQLQKVRSEDALLAEIKALGGTV